MAEEKKTCIFGEALEGGYPCMLVTALEDKYPRRGMGEYVFSQMEDMLAGVAVDLEEEPVTIRFTAKKMTQKEIDALPDL